VLNGHRDVACIVAGWGRPVGIKNANAYSLKTVLGLGVHSVPTYQRDYAWSTRQLSTFWDDIVATSFPGGYPGTMEQHYLGALVVVDYDEALGSGQEGLEAVGDPVFHVVDGQQRLATSVLYFAALRDAVSGDDQIDAESRLKLCGQIGRLIETDEDAADGQPILKVVLNENDNAFFRALTVSGLKTIPASRTSHRRIQAAYRFFRRSLTEYAEDVVEKRRLLSSRDAFYKTVLGAVRQHFEITYIEVDTVQSAFQVFESLNAKGLSLSAADLVKNLLLHMSRKEGHTVASAYQKWSEMVEAVGDANVVVFLRHFLCSTRGETVRKADIYPVIREIVSTNGSMKTLVELSRQGKLYSTLTCVSNPSAFQKAEHAAERSLAELRLVGYQQVYILLLAALEQWGIGGRLDMAVRQLISFLVRHSICERNPNKLEVLFTEWALKIRKGELDETALAVLLKQQMPGDDEFVGYFEQLRIADGESMWGRYLLIRLEQRLTPGNGKLVDLQDLTLEHVIPRAVEVEEWFGGTPPKDDDLDEAIRSIGNLQLLYAPDNSAASNKGYPEKLRVYTSPQCDSEGNPLPIPCETFVLIADLVDRHPEQFVLADVEARAKQLAELAVVTWA